MFARLFSLFRPSPAVRDAATALIAAHGAAAPDAARAAAHRAFDPANPDAEAGRTAWAVVHAVERRLGVVRQADAATRWLERNG